MINRVYPISEKVFNDRVLPIIERHTTPLGGRLPKISHYVCFCAILKMLMVSLAWRDCPQEYGSWHTMMEWEWSFVEYIV